MNVKNPIFINRLETLFFTKISHLYRYLKDSLISVPSSKAPISRLVVSDVSARH